jgi:hypothetical protein
MQKALFTSLCFINQAGNLGGKIATMARRKFQKPQKRPQKNPEAWFLNECLRKHNKIMGKPEKAFLLKNFAKKNINLFELGEIPRLRTPLEINMVRIAFEKGRKSWPELKEVLLAENREAFWKAMGITAKAPAPFSH